MSLFNYIWIASMLEMGIIPEHELCLYKIPDYQQGLIISTTYYVDYSVTANFLKYCFATGGLTAFSFKTTDSYDFYPLRMDFQIGAGIKYKSVEVGWHHGCYHPIAPLCSSIPLPLINAAQDRFYVRYAIESSKK